MWNLRDSPYIHILVIITYFRFTCREEKFCQHVKKSRNILFMIVHKFRLILISRLYIGCFLLNFAEIWHPPPVTYWTSGHVSPVFAGIIRKPKSTPQKGHFRFWLLCDKIFLEFHHMIRNLKWFSTIYTRELQEGKD